MAESFFSKVEMGPKDPILGVAQAFRADTFEEKINVGVGAYRDHMGKPWVLPSVKAAEDILHAQQLDMEYLPIEGHPRFIKLATELAYGSDCPALKEDRVVALQSLSGTGALRLAAGLFSRFPIFDNFTEDQPHILVSNPTWGNHYQIFEHVGLKVGSYRYWSAQKKGLDFEGMCEDLNKAPAHTVVVFHAAAHNPTGVDPTIEQWQVLSQICLQRKLFVLFDNAYQGFASGDPEKDIAAVRLFVKDGHHLILCQSFAKNFGLYGQRVGNFTIICATSDEKERVLSQMKIIARSIYSNPPLQGARIVATILDNPELKSQWMNDIKTMSGRIMEMRKQLRQYLIDAGSVHNWDHITNQIGMFSYTGLTREQSQALTDKHHIYLTLNGRISMAGVTEHNVKRLAYAIHDVTSPSQSKL